MTSLKLMEVLCAKEKPMSTLSEGFTMYPQVLENVRVQDKAAAQADEAVQAAVRRVADALGTRGVFSCARAVRSR